VSRDASPDAEQRGNATEGTNVFRPGDLSSARPRVDRAEGVWVYDTEGRRYLDAAGGAVVVGIGHGVPEVLTAMQEQASRVSFAYYAQFASDAQEELAKELARFCPADLNHVFFTSGGSEAVESAIKLSRSYFLATGRPRKYKVIGRWRSYHGNTLGALSASGHVSRRRNYQPYLIDFPHIAPPYCYRCFLRLAYPACALACADELERAIIEAGPDEVAAFIAEPVPGSSVPGMIAPPEYFRVIREICDRYDVLLVADEILCGMGRTGKNTAMEHWGVLPDLTVMGKGLSSGYSPLGAVVARSHVYRALADGPGHFEHGFTYSGNPLSCATGLAVLRYLQEHRLVERAADTGAYLLGRLRDELSPLELVGDIDGLGLLAGVELVHDRTTRQPFRKEEGVAGRVVARAFGQGLILLPGSGGQADGVNGDRIEIAPPLIVDRDEIDLIVRILRTTLCELSGELQSGHDERFGTERTIAGAV
jgi:adenosylmethionine-8-amino-7-oxononanoate aminotransferase